MKKEKNEDQCQPYNGKLEVNNYTGDRFRWYNEQLLSEKKYYEVIQGKNDE